VLRLDDLGPRRSLGLCRPSVFRFMSDPARYRAGTRATLARLAAGLAVDVFATLPLSQAGEAHRLLESGRTTGAVVLLPD
jgi:NADPH:quinone reductase